MVMNACYQIIEILMYIPDADRPDTVRPDVVRPDAVRPNYCYT